jgi:hypothetical protein
MKRLIYILNFVLIFGCTSASVVEEEQQVTEVLDKTVRIEVLTAQENDAIYITYYQYETNDTNWQQYFFTYDAQGNAEPIVINFEDYDFRYIEGEVYRNNTITSELFLKIYVDDELVVDESDTGDGTDFVNIKFNYDILKEENI